MAVKQSRNEGEMEAMKKQSELIWKFRDQLHESLRTSDLKVLLQANKQAIPSGESRVKPTNWEDRSYLYTPLICVDAGPLC